VGFGRTEARIKVMSAYLTPVLLALAIVFAGVVAMLIVSLRSAGPGGKSTPIGADSRTPLGASDEGSDAPPSRERIA